MGVSWTVVRCRVPLPAWGAYAREERGERERKYRSCASALRPRGRLNFGEFQLGLSVYSINYRLQHANHVQITEPTRDRGWTEWTPTLGVPCGVGADSVVSLSQHVVATAARDDSRRCIG